MKVRSAGWFVAALAIGLVVGAGCSKDDEGDDNNNNNNNGPSGSELSESQRELVVQSSNSLALQSVSTAMNAVVMLQGGGFLAGEAGDRELDDPPAGWEGPDSVGWYHNTEVEGGFDVYLKFTPDIWANPELEADRLDMRYVMHDIQQGQGSVEYSYWSEYSDDRTTVSGAYSYDFTLTQEIPGSAPYDFSWHQGATWSGVTVDPNDYSGHFTTSGTYIVPSETGMPVEVVLSGVFDFNADGTGTGATSIGGEDFIHYTFTSAEPTHGFYTLKNENFEIEHQF